MNYISQPQVIVVVNFYYYIIRYFRNMSRSNAAKNASKAPEKKAFRAEDYASATIPVE